MEKEKLEYIEETGLMFERLGMTRMAGRVFGYIIVSDDEAVSFDQIRLTLSASKGSISNTMKQLMHIDFIKPVSLSGDRKTYYSIAKPELGSLLKSRINLFVPFAKLMNKGRRLKSQEDDISDWLLEVSAFYSWVVDELEGVIEKWHREKENIINQNKLES